MLAKLVVTVKDGATGAAMPYVSVETNGVGLSTGLDGTAIFDLPQGTLANVKVRSLQYRPWSQSVLVNKDRVEVTANMEKAAL